MTESPSTISRLHAIDLLRVSKTGPVFRSVFLPSLHVDECIAFYESLGFARSDIVVEGYSSTIPAVKNDWHTLIFVQVNSMPARTAVQDIAEAVPTELRLLVSSIGDHVLDVGVDTPLPGIRCREAKDPDGRAIMLCERTEPRTGTSAGVLCWIEMLASFQHVFLRIDSVESPSVSVSWSGSKCSAFFPYTPDGRFVFEGPQLRTLDQAAATEFMTALTEHARGRTAADEYVEEEIDQTYYQFLAIDMDSVTELVLAKDRLAEIVRSKCPSIGELLLLG
jgi:hypothetical protein